MRDVGRDEITRLVYRRLADPRFRDRLSARAPDGTCPVVVALRDDSLRSLVDQLIAAGGAANVAVPVLNGIVVLAVHAEAAHARRGAGTTPPTRLAADCTVGLLVARFQIDAEDGEAPAYHFVVEGPHRQRERARAELVALAG